jgi:hypothetical protein
LAIEAISMDRGFGQHTGSVTFDGTIEFIHRMIDDRFTTGFIEVPIPNQSGF